MALSSIFKQLQKKAEKAGITAEKSYTKKSKDWFIKNLKTLRIPQKKVLNDSELEARKKPLIGRLFFFQYDPKGKETLPYYDTFPLIIMVGPAEKGFYGLNLHYLSPRMRAVFFDELMTHMNNDKMNHTTRIKVTYEMLQAAAKMRAFEPCFKRYLFKHMVSRTVEVPPEHWELALFMPVSNFVGATQESVWRDSKYNMNLR